jgi:hypothetical protein
MVTRVQRRRRIEAILAIVLLIGVAWLIYVHHRSTEATAASIGGTHCPKVLPSRLTRDTSHATNHEGPLIGSGAKTGFICFIEATISNTSEPRPPEIDLGRKDLQRVIAAINASPVVRPGTYECLIDDGSGYYLRIGSGKPDHTITVNAAGCRSIRSSDSRIIRRAQPSLLQLLSDIVN